MAGTRVGVLTTHLGDRPPGAVCVGEDGADAAGNVVEPHERPEQRAGGTVLAGDGHARAVFEVLEERGGGGVLASMLAPLPCLAAVVVGGM